MENINVFLNEVNSLDIISERYYFIPQLGYIPERDCLDNGFDKAILRGYNSKEFMTLNEVKKADLKRTYLGAKADLILLSNEQLTNARKTLLSFDSKHIYKQLGEFYVKVANGKQHPSDETDFKYLLNSNFICDIPVIGGGFFSIDFLSNLTNEYMNKRGYVNLLVNDIDNLLQTTSNILPHLTRSLKPKEQLYLFSELVKGEFISKDEDFDNFCFAFGGKYIGKEFNKIKWLKNKQCLRDLLSKIKFNNDADMLRAVEHYFLDNKGQKMKLASNKHDPYNRDQLIISDILKEFEEL